MRKIEGGLGPSSSKTEIGREAEENRLKSTLLKCYAIMGSYGIYAARIFVKDKIFDLAKNKDEFIDFARNNLEAGKRPFWVFEGAYPADRAQLVKIRIDEEDSDNEVVNEIEFYDKLRDDLMDYLPDDLLSRINLPKMRFLGQEVCFQGF